MIIGIAHEISGNRAFELVGSAMNSHDLVGILDRSACDVLVTDYSMPGGLYGDGIALLTFIKRRFPGVNIVVITMMDNPGIIRSLLKNDIRCLLSKADSVSHITDAIYAAYGHRPYYSPTIGGFISNIEAGNSSGGLTQREIEVLRLFVSGLTVKQITEQLNRSKQTVSAQKRSAMKKLGISTDSELFKYAIQTDLNNSSVDNIAQHGDIIDPLSHDVLSKDVK